MSKRDRQGVRTPAGLEQKYDLGNKFKSQSVTNMTTAERIVYLDRTMTDNQSKNDASVESLRTEDASIRDTLVRLNAETIVAINAINERIGEINQNIDTVEADVESLKTGKVNKADVVNDFTTTAEGKVADARTVKLLNDKFKIVRQMHSVSLAQNDYCKPFSYFGSYNISYAIQSYGFPIGVYLYTAASVPMPCYFSDGVVRMASSEAGNTLVVDYLNGGYQ
jgi:hypothetical protein